MKLKKGHSKTTLLDEFEMKEIILKDKKIKERVFKDQEIREVIFKDEKIEGGFIEEVSFDNNNKKQVYAIRKRI